MVETMELDGDGQCDCPICGEYHGAPESVEAHITGKSDDAHRGQIGKDYRVVEDGDRKLSKDPEPELKGKIPVPGNGLSNEQVTSQEMEDVEDDGEEDERDDQALSAVIVGALFFAVWWLARRTGNEDQISDPTAYP